VLTVKEVMVELRMSRNAIYEAISRREIPSIRVGRKILIPRALYDRMLRGEAA
jgi:excisionase family DNA binding protein